MDDILNQFHGESLFLQALGRWSYKIQAERAVIVMYIHLIISALFPIYIGAHASLFSPSSAQNLKSSKKAVVGGTKEDDDDDDDDDELDNVLSGIQSLQPSDAIMFPVMAGIILGAFYLLIKWLNDPKILSRILNCYLSGIGIFGVGQLATATLNTMATFIFPKVWATKTEVFLIDQRLSCQFLIPVQPDQALNNHRILAKDKTNPFPGAWSILQFSSLQTSRLWNLRSLLLEKSIFRGYVRNLFHIVKPLRLNDALGVIFGLVTILLYNFYGHSWWLSNIIAFGFCYGALQILSPTTFWTGTLVLLGLFIYDVTMVFYTPLMMTVASSLDVPIKLVFPGPKRGSMLGLGDVVFPGIMISLALRFDLYLHYLRKQRPCTTHKKSSVLKADYVEATGVWGERYWTSSLTTMAHTIADGARFQKVYFWASIIGYIIGMIVTLLVMNKFKHAQPALLYLVPGVLCALWATAWFRGEINLMWEYTEDDSFQKDGKEEKEGTATIVAHESKVDSKTSGTSTVDSNKKMQRRTDKHAQHFFLFSLTTPRARSTVEPIGGVIRAKE